MTFVWTLRTHEGACSDPGLAFETNITLRQDPSKYPIDLNPKGTGECGGLCTDKIIYIQ